MYQNTPSEIDGSEPSVEYTRNGRLQACRPCKVSKLRCDHKEPCTRCVKRNISCQCIYSPGGRSKLKQVKVDIRSAKSFGVKAIAPTKRGLSTANNTGRTDTGSSPTAPAAVGAVEALRQSNSSTGYCSSDFEKIATHHTRGFLGLTSHSSIFGDAMLNDPSLEPRSLHDPALHAERIHRGIRVLSFLASAKGVPDLIARYFETHSDGGICAQGFMEIWLEGLWEPHGGIFGSHDPFDIRTLCETIWKKSGTPLRFHQATSARQWAQQASGLNIRWSVIGLIASIAGNSAEILHDSDDIFTRLDVPRISLMRQMHSVSQECVALCRECGSLEDMFIWLLMGHHYLSAGIVGDYDYRTYCASGEICNAIVELGWHQSVGDEIPFFLRELRKRTLAKIYSIEISLATFLGRPPRLSYRYCSITMHLDLRDDQVMLDEKRLREATAKLDSAGFNTDTDISHSAYVRLCFDSAKTREDILDIALGSITLQDISDPVATIREKYERQLETVPAFISRLLQESVRPCMSRPDLDSRQLLLLYCIRFSHHANKLLLALVLIRKAGTRSDDLITAAQCIVRDVLDLSRHNGLTQTSRTDISNILVFQGLRAASILGVELLRVEEQPQAPGSPILSRSRTIQDLSILADRLDGVDSTDGLFPMCRQGRKAILRILNRILETPSRPSSSRQQHNLECGAVLLSSGPTLTARCDDPSQSTSASPASGFEFDLQTALLGYDLDFTKWLETTNFDMSL